MPPIGPVGAELVLPLPLAGFLLQVVHTVKASAPLETVECSRKTGPIKPVCCLTGTSATGRRAPGFPVSVRRWEFNGDNTHHSPAAIVHACMPVYIGRKVPPLSVLCLISPPPPPQSGNSERSLVLSPGCIARAWHHVITNFHFCHQEHRRQSVEYFRLTFHRACVSKQELRVIEVRAACMAVAPASALPVERLSCSDHAMPDSPSPTADTDHPGATPDWLELRAARSYPNWKEEEGRPEDEIDHRPAGGPRLSYLWCEDSLTGPT